MPDTNVLITRFLSEDGVGELIDFMPVDDRRQGTHRQRLVRRVLCVKGSMHFNAEVEPRFDYGRATADIAVTDDGAVFASPDLTLSLSAPVALERTEAGVRAGFALDHGQSATFVLEQGEQPRPYSEDDTRELFNETVDYWLRWIAAARYQGRWREIVRRSALTLKLLTYRPTGAIIAAATTSLPEQLGGERNWDYRFTWIRDAAFSLYGLLRLGFTEEAAAFGGWLTDRFREGHKGESGPLQVMYAIDGSSDLEEQILDHLEGYCGSAPVRIGNGAADQLQLDIYGELVDSVYLYNKYGTPISHDAWMDLTHIVDWVSENWDQPDEGIWETRGGRQHFTYSRLMCWVAVERSIRMARQRGLPADLVAWARTRDDIYRQIMEKGWNEERGAFVQHYGSDVLDASNLLMPLVKFVVAEGSSLALHARPDDGGARLRHARLPLQREGLAGRAGGRGGHVLDLLLLVRGGAGARRAARSRANRLREDAHVRQPPGPFLRGDRPARRAARQLPAGVHAPGADQRRDEPRPPARLVDGARAPYRQTARRPSPRRTASSVPVRRNPARSYTWIARSLNSATSSTNRLAPNRSLANSRPAVTKASPNPRPVRSGRSPRP